MRVLSERGCGALLAVTFAAASAHAQEPAPAGDPERGKAISYTCIGCHGIPNYKNAYPNYSVPKLAGQYQEYLVTALKAYRSGERAHPTMQAQSASLSDADMADIAAYFAGPPLKSDGRPDAGPPPKSAAVCVACHGQDGIGTASLYPNLAGQHADYMAQALADYKRGGRKNAIMAGFAGPLTIDQIAELSEYYAKQRPALANVRDVPPRVSGAR